MDGDAGQGDWGSAMLADDERNPTKEIPDSLTFSQEQVNFILGHSLRSLYQDLLNAPVPEHLKALLNHMEERPSSPPKTPSD